jgi:hypothetical protein
MVLKKNGGSWTDDAKHTLIPLPQVSFFLFPLPQVSCLTVLYLLLKRMQTLAD